jgi:hypothetical protein
VSFLPDPSRAVLAVSSGQRHYALPEDMRDEDEDHNSSMGSMGEATKTSSEQHRNVVEVYDFSQ